MQNMMLRNKVSKQETTGSPAEQENSVWKTVIEDLTDPASDMSEDEKKAYEARVLAKMKRGGKLNAEEMNFLRLHNPELYRSALRVKLRKEQLVQQLKHCRSKSEAADVARRAVSSIGSKDPDKEFMVAGLSETFRQFKKSSAYARLPQTEDEQKKKGRKSSAVRFEEKAEGESSFEMTPIQEVLDELPVFDVVQ